MKHLLMRPEVIYIEEDEFNTEEKRLVVSAKLDDKVYAVSVIDSSVETEMRKYPGNTKANGIAMVTNTLNYIKKYGVEAFEKGEFYDKSTTGIHRKYEVIDLTEKP